MSRSYDAAAQSHHQRSDLADTACSRVSASSARVSTRLTTDHESTCTPPERLKIQSCPLRIRLACESTVLGTLYSASTTLFSSISNDRSQEVLAGRSSFMKRALTTARSMQFRSSAK